MRKSIQERLEEGFVPEPNSGCWLWIKGVNNKGYGQIFTDGKQQSAHRVSWALHVGKIEPGMCVLHKCDTPLCINPKHLFLGTQQDNLSDMTAKGRRIAGEKVVTAKLKECDVLAIRNLLESGELSQRAIAGKFGISQASVSRILIGTSWRAVR